MITLALIPARGGSKSIPRKNIALLSGRPLLAYTADAALNRADITRCVLSTDDSEIAEIGRGLGLEVPFVRPEQFSRDDTPSIDVAIHALDWVLENDGWEPEVLVLLQPTSPLRTSTHIREALTRMQDANADTVVSVVPVPHRYSPYSVMKLEDGLLGDFWAEPLPFDRFRRQNLPVLYARNGPAVLATRVSVIRANRSFYGERVVPYPMTELDSIDIDHPFDLAVAEAALKFRESA